MLDALRRRARAARTRLAARERWLASLRAIESRTSASRSAREPRDPRSPLHPVRVYGELAPLLDRDAIVIGDGGDFVSFAGRVVDSTSPAAGSTRGRSAASAPGPATPWPPSSPTPSRQVVLLQGDGAFGFSGMEWDTLARHGVAVIGVMGNNGIWALEKHPMELLYGYSVAAELQPETRYDQVVEVLGGHGELVRSPASCARRSSGRSRRGSRR